MKFTCPCCRTSHNTGYGTQYKCACGAVLVGKSDGSVLVLKKPTK